jgi:hypothetical protein
MQENALLDHRSDRRGFISDESDYSTQSKNISCLMCLFAGFPMSIDVANCMTRVLRPQQG